VTQKGAGPPLSAVRPRPSGRPNGIEEPTESDLVVGSLGTQSGPIGSAVVQYLVGAQTWVQARNRAGGLNGHRIRLLLYDDGGDPARHTALARKAIEQDHVIAFLQNNEPLTGQASQDYITRQRVPVVGLSGGESWGYSSPMYFPQMTVGRPIAYIYLVGVAQQLVPQGKGKLGIITCVEVQICVDADQIWTKYAGRVGFELVYHGRATLTQPDYTAQCLNARSAGAQVIVTSNDPNSVGRLAASCARQDYHPTFGLHALLTADRMKGDPNIDGAAVVSNVFPHYQTGTPATDEFQQAMRASGRGEAIEPQTAAGWVSGKLLERAGLNLPEPPTSAALLEGLWSLKGDTLGGLTQPLSFTKDQPAVPRACWFNSVVKAGAWVSPDAFAQACREVPADL
jgi:branched-chain amino acid transport system substrate-binding protein